VQALATARMPLAEPASQAPQLQAEPKPGGPRPAPARDQRTTAGSAARIPRPAGTARGDGSPVHGKPADRRGRPGHTTRVRRGPRARTDPQDRTLPGVRTDRRRCRGPPGTPRARRDPPARKGPPGLATGTDRLRHGCRPARARTGLRCPPRPALADLADLATGLRDPARRATPRRPAVPAGLQFPAKRPGLAPGATPHPTNQPGWRHLARSRHRRGQPGPRRGDPRPRHRTDQPGRRPPAEPRHPAHRPGPRPRAHPPHLTDQPGRRRPAEPRPAHRPGPRRPAAPRILVCPRERPGRAGCNGRPPRRGCKSRTLRARRSRRQGRSEPCRRTGSAGQSPRKARTGSAGRLGLAGRSARPCGPRRHPAWPVRLTPVVLALMRRAGRRSLIPSARSSPRCPDRRWPRCSPNLPSGSRRALPATRFATGPLPATGRASHR
jgi:hypothetical protein